jgi:hypothetical protein
MLRRIDAANRSFDESAIPLEFVCALARNCFLSNYAFFAADDENAAVQSLRSRMEASLEDATEDVAVLAMYVPLPRLRDVEPLRRRAWSPGLAKLVEEQIEDRIREAALASRHPPVTPIDDPVSLAVNAQYEDNPYPRWKSVSDADEATFEQLYAHLHGHPTERAAPDPLRILIAGCGSGRHPIRSRGNFLARRSSRRPEPRKPRIRRTHERSSASPTSPIGGGRAQARIPRRTVRHHRVHRRAASPGRADGGVAGLARLLAP